MPATPPGGGRLCATGVKETPAEMLFTKGSLRDDIGRFTLSSVQDHSAGANALFPFALQGVTGTSVPSDTSHESPCLANRAHRPSLPHVPLLILSVLLFAQVFGAHQPRVLMNRLQHVRG